MPQSESLKSGAPPHPPHLATIPSCFEPSLTAIDWLEVSLTRLQDLPLQWAPAHAPISDSAEKKQKSTAKAKAGKAKAKVKGRGKGKCEETTNEGEPEKPKAKTGPSLLANLVRCGNQMANASSWAIINAAFAEQIRSKLRILPTCQLSMQRKLQLEQENIKTLTMLGIWQTPEDLEKKKKTDLMETAEELMLFLVSTSGFVCFIVAVSFVSLYCAVI